MRILAILIVSSCVAVSSFAAIAKTGNIVLKRSTMEGRMPMSMDAVSLSGGSEPEILQKPSGGSATIATSTFNLAKSVIGAGVLSLPSGVAFLADEPSALVPAAALCTLFGIVAAYSFSAIGRICKENNAQSFQEAWEKLVSPNSAWLISGSITALCFLASLAYCIIMGDSFSSLFQTFQLPALVSERSNTILAMSALVLLPLCSLKSLSALAPFSLLGLGGTLYTAIFMMIRYMDGSYAEGGQFFSDIAIKPSFSARGGYSIASFNAFVLVSMMSTSFVAHYNAPTFMNELKDATVPRFNQVVNGGFIAAILLFIFVMSVGFMTFGGNSLGFVLNNYSNKDILATVARFAIGLALITGFPFTFSALRNGVLDLAKLKGPSRDNAFTPVTVAGLALLTGLALVLKDVGFVVSISGAMFGCAVMFIIPAIMNIANIKLNAKNFGSEMTSGNKIEVAGNYGMMLTGIAMAIVGVSVSVLREMGKL
mmetsp:Transcript_53807/g.106138  ORF Transcript_53807/g.106138 Transcript_53807/m.106138 type:complete len:483 (+) Transcript_53807:102-1550(+)